MQRIQRLQDDIAVWSDATFGVGRHPLAPLSHLVKELSELIDEPCDRMEYADCLMLLLDAYRMAGGNADDMVTACFQKLEINKLRKWGEPDANGVVEHIRGSSVYLGWREDLPDEQGYWWWWDCDGLPVPVYIAYSGTDNTYFATPNQLGWNRHQSVKDMCGMWMRLPEPPTPQAKEIYCHACSIAGGAEMPIYHLPPVCPVNDSP